MIKNCTACIKQFGAHLKRSRTIKWNVLLLVATSVFLAAEEILQVTGMEDLLSAKTFGIIIMMVSIVNIILRYVTTQPLGDK